MKLSHGDLVVNELLDRISNLTKELAIEKARAQLLSMELQIYKQQLKGDVENESNTTEHTE